MKMIFLAGDDSLQAIVETLSYRDIWRQHQLKLLEAFASATGLLFQQKQITARVYPNRNGEAGNGLKAMTLPGNCRTHSAKCIVLSHELGHRLLSGNLLHGVRLGFSKPRWGDPEDSEDELEHRLLYLFLGDVIRFTFGSDAYREYVSLESYDHDSPHGRAYTWAMGMTATQRRSVFDNIASEVIPRGNWDSYDPAKIKYIGPESYQAKLDGLRNTVKNR